MHLHRHLSTLLIPSQVDKPGRLMSLLLVSSGVLRLTVGSNVSTADRGSPNHFSLLIMLNESLWSLK